MNLFRAPSSDLRPGSVDCTLQLAGSDAITISSLYVAEDRSAQLRPFVEQLARRAAAANPALILQRGGPVSSRIFYLVMTGLALAVVFVTLTMMLAGRGRDSPLAYMLLVVGAAAGAFYQGAMLLESWPRRCDPHGTDWHDVWTRL